VTQRSKSKEGLIKVFFDVPEEDRSVMKTESLWAEPVGGDRYRLRNVPFLVFGFSEQDVITATENDGTLRVTGVAVRGGHSTYRLVLPEDTNEEKFLQDWIPSSVVTLKPANDGQGKTGQREWPGLCCFYPAASCVGKSVFVRQLRGPHLSTWP